MPSVVMDVILFYNTLFESLCTKTTTTTSQSADTQAHARQDERRASTPPSRRAPAVGITVFQGHSSSQLQ